jgi:hypothetical protein
MMQKQNKPDVEYISAIISTTSAASTLYIIDARPKINAAANRGMCVA